MTSQAYLLMTKGAAAASSPQLGLVLMSSCTDDSFYRRTVAGAHLLSKTRKTVLYMCGGNVAPHVFATVHTDRVLM